MKCVKLLQTGEIYRVSNVMALTVVEIGQAVYTNKQAWKNAGRKTTKSLYTDVNTEITDKQTLNMEKEKTQ